MYDRSRAGKYGTNYKLLGTVQVSIDAARLPFSSVVRKVCHLFAADLPPGLEERIKEIDDKIYAALPDTQQLHKLASMVGERIPVVSKLSDKLRRERNKKK
jgi:hypothetical protein